MAGRDKSRPAEEFECVESIRVVLASSKAISRQEQFGGHGVRFILTEREFWECSPGNIGVSHDNRAVVQHVASALGSFKVVYQS